MAYHVQTDHEPCVLLQHCCSDQMVHTVLDDSLYDECWLMADLV